MARKAQGNYTNKCLSVCLHIVRCQQNKRKIRVIKSYLMNSHDDYLLCLAFLYLTMLDKLTDSRTLLVSCGFVSVQVHRFSLSVQHHQVASNHYFSFSGINFQGVSREQVKVAFFIHLLPFHQSSGVHQSICNNMSTKTNKLILNLKLIIKNKIKQNT